jgi:hypothetical protein
MKARAFTVLSVVIGGCAILAGGEISTGFLVGPRYDAHAFYVRPGPAASWEKTYQGRDFRRQAQGKLFGGKIGKPDPAALDTIAAAGMLLVSVALQDESGANAFRPDGSLDAGWAARLDAFLKAADSRGIAVQLICFHQAQDQRLDSQEAILAAARNLTDWLIDRDYRHVVLTPAEDWSQPGWDHDHFVAAGQEQIISAMRDRFQERRVDFALPIAVFLDVRLRADSPLLDAADVLILAGDGRALDARRVERPAVIVASDAWECERFETASGCLFAAPAAVAQTVPPLIYSRPPRRANRSK